MFTFVKKKIPKKIMKISEKKKIPGKTGKVSFIINNMELNGYEIYQRFLGIYLSV